MMDCGESWDAAESIMPIKGDRIPPASAHCTTQPRTIRSGVEAAPVPDELFDEIRHLRARVAELLHRAEVAARAA
jgi:hypothetical protein